MREVEAEVIGRNQASLLCDVRAKMASQRGMQQVGRAMVRANAVPSLAVDFLMDRVPDRQLSSQDFRAQHVKLAKRLRRVLNLAIKAFERGQVSGVAHLATA